MEHINEFESQIKKLQENIAQRKGRYSISYRDSMDLQQILKIINSILKEKNLDEISLENCIKNLIYVASAYDKMNRYGASLSIYKQALECVSRLYIKYKVRYKYYRSIIKNSLNISKLYFDNHQDIYQICIKFLEDNIVKDIFEKHKSEFGLKYDSVETTDAYLKVIDIVDEKIEIQSKKYPIFGLGSCHYIWELKQKYLKELGINWRSPRELNRHVRFD